MSASPPELVRQTNQLCYDAGEAWAEYTASRMMGSLGEKWKVERAEMGGFWILMSEDQRLHVRVVCDVPHKRCASCLLFKRTEYGWFGADGSKPFEGTPDEVIFYAEQVMKGSSYLGL